jgi:protein O-GlcNAc transferase
LDPFPYAGHTTTIDSIWMGVPVITLSGQTHVSRVGVSLLTNVGLTETIATSGEHYIEIASRLARNLPLLSRLRQRLRDQLRRSPVYDQAAFARALEAGYRQAWIEWCRSAPSPSGRGLG